MVKSQKAASYQRHRTETIAAVTAYTEANRTKVRERRRKHREANKERLATNYAEWAKDNRPLLRIHEKRRRDRKRGASGKHTFADIQDIGRMQGWQCANPLCRIPVRDGYHVDHIVPIALGGSNGRRNIQLLCAPCNQSKHALDPIEWAQTQGLLL
jgi:5-methylcytosine-specific restriction endonuclease McrA